MNIIELIKTALRALGANKTRTFLTMLGIIIGIGSVITLLAIGNGAQASITSSVSSLGSNLLTITAGAQQTGVVRDTAGTAQTLTRDDADAISSSVQNLDAVSPEFSRGAQVLANGTNTNTQVTGALPDYLTAHNYQIDTGSFITKENDIARAKVAVIGPDTAKNLFGDNSAIGQTIKINKIVFRVIGVTVSKGNSGFLSQDDFVIVPLSTAQKVLFGQDNLRSIVVQTKDADSLTQAQADITTLLLSRHKIDNPQNADFTIRSSADTLAALSTVTGTLAALLASIAGISLVVGGIGIMNIMIVTVTERTKEIGLRKAVGATNKIILAQFLVEAIMLTLLGGLIGVAIGMLISSIIGSVASLNPIVSVSSVILSVSVSVIVGVVFGLYPALKASRLRPIEALRFE